MEEYIQIIYNNEFLRKNLLGDDFNLSKDYFEQIDSFDKNSFDSRNLFELKYDKGYYHLHICVLLTKSYPFINNYIKLYLDLFPNKVDIVNVNGITPLALSLMYSKSHSSLSTINLLINYGANINKPNKFGWTPLMQSITNLSCSIDALRLVLDKGALVDFQDSNGVTALSLASMNTSDNDIIDNVKLLLNYNANPNCYPYGKHITRHFIDHRRNVSKECLDTFLKYDSIKKYIETDNIVKEYLIFRECNF